MIMAIAKGAYGQNKADFLMAHLPNRDAGGMADYEIKDVNALNNGGCRKRRGGAVGEVFDESESLVELVEQYNLISCYCHFFHAFRKPLPIPIHECTHGEKDHR